MLQLGFEWILGICDSLEVEVTLKILDFKTEMNV